MVRRDKEMSNLSKLSESGNSPTVLWEIANAAVGKPASPSQPRSRRRMALTRRETWRPQT
jgi:hypothetical protein